MNEIGTFEAKNKLGILLDWVENGEEVIISRHGKAITHLISIQEINRTKARQASANMLYIKKSPHSTILETKDLINV